MKRFGFYLVFLLITAATASGQKRNLLQKAADEAELSKSLARGSEWVHFPAYSERQEWSKISDELQRSIIKAGEEALKFRWPVIKATDYLEFNRSGNREVMQRPQRERNQALTALTLAELVEGKGRFIDGIIDGVWAVCEQASWVYSAHLYIQTKSAGLPDGDDIVIDLGAGEIGAMLAWVHHYFSAEFDKINPLIAKTLRRTINERILEPYYKRSFWWMGLDGRSVNNWNPWINHNVLQCILLMETDSAKRVENIRRAIFSIDAFINAYPDDGGCDEGPSYWGHAGGRLFECLDLLYRASGGKIDIFDNKLIKNIGKYICGAYIGDLWFVNFADAGAKTDINAGVVFRYGKAIGDLDMQSLASYYIKRKKASPTPSGLLHNALHEIFDNKELAESLAVEPREPLILESWLPDLQFVAARDKANSRKGFFFAAKGGHNNESHNHNDVGSCILFYDCKPILIDVGVGAYTRQTFSSERYSIWTMQSGYHNLPVINGIDQKNGSKFRARDVVFKSNKNNVEFSVDISGAYPSNAGVKSWIRAYNLKRGNSFTISDRYELVENRGGSSLNFMTACKVSVDKLGILVLEGDGFKAELSYDSSKIKVRTENIKLEDNNLKRSWGEDITRIIMDLHDKKLTDVNKIQIRIKN
ncbi:MAG: heparinase II/III-family protein [Prevotellaceae bacterium]|jgi:hypothetical protein|nr:heparinase II/III-family protein [Prevotellaceae bacterium]